MLLRFESARKYGARAVFEQYPPPPPCAITVRAMQQSTEKVSLLLACVGVENFPIA